jgi:hypothetical protein
MTFFDTKAGHEFTDFIIPKLVDYTDKIANKKQYTVRCQPAAVIDTIEARVKDGYRYVNHIDFDKTTLIIFEK